MGRTTAAGATVATAASPSTRTVKNVDAGVAAPQAEVDESVVEAPGRAQSDAAIVHGHHARHAGNGRLGPEPHARRFAPHDRAVQGDPSA
jgi:hypothetical protein